MALLQEARNTADAQTLKMKIDELSQASDFFAMRRMDYAIKRALAGHTLDEIEQG